MQAEERQGPTDSKGNDAEKVEEIEDLEASEYEAAHVKGGGPKEQQTRPGGGPTD